MMKAVYCRVVTLEMGKKLATEWNASFVEASAKQNEVINWAKLIAHVVTA